MTENNKSWEIYLPKEDEKISLDLRDLKILDALINNSRTNLARLSQLTKLSKPSIINRIQKLEKQKILSGNSAFIDFTKIGVHIYDIEVKSGLSIMKKQVYLDYLKKTPGLMQILTLSHKDYDLRVRVCVLNDDDLNEILEYITSNNVLDISISCVKKIVYAGLNLFNLEKESFAAKKDTSFSKAFELSEKKYDKLSAEDIKLLFLLSQNSRLTIRELADKLDLVTDTVKNKINNLIRSKTIMTFFAKYDIYRLGLNPYLLKIKIFNRLKTKELIRFLADFNRCHGIFRFNESWNVMGTLSFKDRSELGKFENHLLNEFGEWIKEYEFILVQEQIYYDTFPQKLKDNLLLRFGKRKISKRRERSKEQ